MDIFCLECGKSILLRDNGYGEISTPLQYYTQPCQFQIIAAVGSRIQLNFIKIFITEIDVNTKVKIYEGNIAGNLPNRTYSSGLSSYPFSFLSNGNEVLVITEDRPGSSRQWSLKFEYYVSHAKYVRFGIFR